MKKIGEMKMNGNIIMRKNILNTSKLRNQNLNHGHPLDKSLQVDLHLDVNPKLMSKYYPDLLQLLKVK